MKILVCASYLHAWNSIRPEAEIFVELSRLGHQVTIMTEGESEYVSRLKEQGIKVIDCYPKSKICIETIKRIRKEIQDVEYDICYAFNSKTIPNAAFACIGLPVKLIAYRGTTGGIYRHDPSAYLTMLHPRIDGIVCVSEAVRQSLLPVLWKNKETTVTIYKGQNVDWYQVKPTPRAELGLKESDIILFCAAHVRPSKGISILLEATHHIEHSNVHLVLAGHGFDAHFDEMKASPMAERIHFIGHRSDVPNLMCMADIQIQPSISGEGLPRTIIEAMANATPSVVTTTGGSPELVEDGKTGYIVPVSDAIAMAQAINLMASDQLKCQQMGQAAQIRLDTCFSSKVTVEKHLEFFNQLLQA